VREFQKPLLPANRLTIGDHINKKKKEKS